MIKAVDRHRMVRVGRRRCLRAVGGPGGHCRGRAEVVLEGRAQRLLDEGRGGAQKLVDITQDPAPTLNTLLFVRILAETVAIVLVSLFIFGRFAATWERVLYSVGIMVLVSFILLGVAPRTMGRQNVDAVALAAARPVAVLTAVLVRFRR
ncbi:MAG: DUF21 domain-containing protein [Micropruina glycogenica]